MEAPSDYKTAGIFMLVAGVMNAMISMIWVLSFIWFFCLGLIWLPVVIVGVLEVATGVSMMQGQPRHNSKIISILGLICGLFTFNWVSIVCEVLSLVWLNKPEVAAWLQEN